MDSVRDELIKILRAPIFPHELADPIEAVADYLLDNGVTIMRWIPATERLPDIERTVLVTDSITGEVTTAYLNCVGSFVFADGRGHGASHWMPLPDAPKEE